MVKSNIVDLGELPLPAPQLAENPFSLFSLKGKVAIVSGASKGIGLAVAEAYASAGAEVALLYNSTPVDEVLTLLKTKYGVNCRGYKCPVTDIKIVNSTVEQVIADFGKVDIFVANAGVGWNSNDILSIEDDDKAYDEWKKILSVDVDAIHFCARAVGKHFKKQGFGSFIVTASMSAHIVNFPQLQAPYNAAKAAVLHYSRSLAVEWAKFARVNTVSPGYVETELVAKLPSNLKDTWLAQVPLGRLANPKEIAGAYVFLASDASSYCTVFVRTQTKVLFSVLQFLLLDFLGPFVKLFLASDRSLSKSGNTEGVSEVVVIPVKGGSVQQPTVVPDNNGVLVPLGTDVGVQTGLDVLDKEREQNIALLLLHTQNSSAEVSVHKQSLLLQNRVISDKRVDRLNSGLSLDTSLVSGVVGLVSRGVQNLQSIKQLLHGWRKSLVGLDGIKELGVTTNVGLQHTEQGDSWGLVFVGNVGVPSDVVQLVGKGMFCLVLATSSKGDVELRVAKRGTRGWVDMQWAELNTTHFGTQLRADLSGLDLRSREQRVKGWIAKVSSVGVLEWLRIGKGHLVLWVPGWGPGRILQTLVVSIRDRVHSVSDGVFTFSKMDIVVEIVDRKNHGNCVLGNYGWLLQRRHTYLYGFMITNLWWWHIIIVVI
ncbi:hypothetical protein OGAPHI_004469 [Ogataea philodendri]|uniref:Peroxisomal 2,4-dienoyl-CoA reductase n=1 Tax=Ogataea philodendri TaxID=1378263 RepID=A0A9P8P762_9ASCO|nr:uncharacterized protein OGAPHI_004469 [Ogataea philodendri]KAH3666280.1 hypothetical protein OGAPHI_004469 [Ogataea philodendri]